MVRFCERLRLVVFVATGAGAWLLISQGRGQAVWLLMAGAVVAFVIVVARHRAARRRVRRAQLMADFNREGIARVERRWSDLPRPFSPPVPRNHDYADDLDLHGHASLVHLAGICGTAPGRSTLWSWLLAPADPRTIALRQEAVCEMAGAFDYRDRIAAEARLMNSDSVEDVEDFLRWCESPDSLSGRAWLRAAAVLLPPVNLAAIILYSLGMVPTAAVAWPLLLSTLVMAPAWKAISRACSEADDGESGVRHYGALLSLLADAPLDSRYAADLRQRLGAGTRPAPREIATLRRLLDMAEARRSPLFHIPLALVFLWDVHVLAALERWKQRSGARVRTWLDVVGEAEALAALAALAADHPGWAMPTLDAEATTLRGRALGHPLLAPELWVRNDVEVGPAGSFLLVTGSNMSGKSTLVKAVGLNVVLGQAGGPVCAEALRIPPLRVVTSIHVTDSLADGVSFFMAGLQRLKQIVDAAETAGATPGPGVLYLLDEILQGTNSAERRIAARTVLRRLLRSGAIGAVTTHDLSLADAEDLNARAVPVHLTESVGDGNEGLTFDYRLRTGIATSTNALRLLQLAGLGDGRRGPSGIGRE
ncbi:MAG: DNA mismatch repair protein MutS [Gammaproteobacteria bacterium]|nr:DNA mismatch repair protein MutS [Gammaproteobacteria bacterium]